MSKNPPSSVESSLVNVVNYYSEKIQQFGPTARGVDWSSTQGQELRFSKLLKVIVESQIVEEPSILDFGCGYGAFFQYLKREYPDLKFLGTGFDLSAEMLEAAISVDPHLTWISNLEDGSIFDFVIASGVFNVKLEVSDSDWKNYLSASLRKLNDASVRGFAFNLLTSYSDKPKMASHLYYADPSEVFHFCKTNFSKHVSLLHDYPLYEFTILVRKLL